MNEQKVPLLQKIGFMLSGGCMIVFNLVTLFALIFFTDLMGLSPAVVGTMLLVSKVVDAVFDPALGTMIDRTETRFGKTKPWIFAGAIGTFVLGILVFVVPGFGSTGKLVWSFITYNGVNIAFSACVLGILTLIPLVTKSQLERVSVTAFQYMGQYIFAIATTAAVMPLITYFNKSTPISAYWKTTLILGGIGFVATMAFLFTAKENVPMQAPTEKAGVLGKESLAALSKNKYFMLLAATFVIMLVAMSVHQSALAQYLIYGLKMPDLASVLIPLFYVGAFLAAILAKSFARFDKLKVIKFAVVGILAGDALRLLTGDSSVPIVIGGEFLIGLGAGFFSVYLPPLLIDTVEYGFFKFKVRNYGLVMSAMTVFQKIAQGVGIALTGYWLEFGGYVSGAVEQSESVAKTLFDAHLLPFAIAPLLGLFLLHFYKLDMKTMEGILVENEKGANVSVDEAGGEEADAATGEADGEV
ncbi:MAG: glycoside-pentoside-hexuronide (GPH):cation symporter [Clostridiales Family XIII bacterium]|nr:glycoside-pentoside-hexuronide (GPH):cation symporter [Clostridiales Family XIII bacterium]